MPMNSEDGIARVDDDTRNATFSFPFWKTGSKTVIWAPNRSASI